MADSNTIGFVGAGQMAEALIRGLLQASFCPAEKIMASDVRNDRLKELEDRYEIQTTGDNAALPNACDTLILAVKPQDIHAALEGLAKRINEGHLIISVAAGVPIGYLEAHLIKGVRVIRVMPNMACLLQVGCSALASGQYATIPDMERAKAILKAVGEVEAVEEKLMDAVTGLSGSGPAYVFLFAEAFIEAGVRMGIYRPVAETLALHTVRGAAEMLIVSGDHPAVLKDRVASPGGTTLAGLAELERGAFRSVILRAVEAATWRSRELGQALKTS
jgi:pyrroline-5-carboxylate reductase